MINNRGVSNTLGFVLLFAVVFGSIAAVSTVGLGALQEGRDTTISQNAALSMESMSDAIEDLREENTTARLSVIRGGGGSLGLGEETRVTVTIQSGPDVVVYDQTSEPIVYRIDDTQIVYEAGSLIRTQDNGGAILIDGPGYSMDDNSVLLPLISTSSSDGTSVSGSTVTTYLEKNHSALAHYQSDTTGDVVFEIETTEQRAPVWEEAMETRIDTANACDVVGTGETVRCESTTGTDRTIIVRDIRIAYDFVS